MVSYDVCTNVKHNSCKQSWKQNLHHNRHSTRELFAGIWCRWWVTVADARKNLPLVYASLWAMPIDSSAYRCKPMHISEYAGWAYACWAAYMSAPTVILMHRHQRDVLAGEMLESCGVISPSPHTHWIGTEENMCAIAKCDSTTE